MKRAILLALSVIVYSGSYGQRTCGTMDLLHKKQLEDPGLALRMDSVRAAKQAYIKSTGRDEDFSQLALPQLPGFVPTGHAETDLKNFAEAKQALYARDPELYRELTRNGVPSNGKR